MKLNVQVRVACVFAVGVLAINASGLRAQTKHAEPKAYSYATTGVLDIPGQAKLLLDESNLGGQEVQIAEFTFPAGTVIKHQHGSAGIGNGKGSGLTDYGFGWNAGN